MDPDEENRRVMGYDNSDTEEVTPVEIVIGIILFVCLFLGVYLMRM